MSHQLPRLALIDSVPALAAYFPLGIVWGVLWEQAGLPPIWGVAFSACVFAGAVQFVALSLLVADASLWGMIAAAFPLAIRNGFYTVALLDRLPRQWLFRIYSAFGLADATFAVIASRPIEQTQNPWYTLPLSFVIQLYWILGTAVGVYSGGYIPDGIASLDFALPALIAVLAMEQHKKLQDWGPLLIAIVTAVSAWALFKHSWLVPALIASTAIIILKPSQEQPL